MIPETWTLVEVAVGWAMPNSELTVGQLAARSGVAVSALHFYEAKGLIRSRRTAGNQRRFSRDTLRRIAFIRVSQRVGIPLKAIREALTALPDERTPTREDWARLSAVWQDELDDRIRQLERLRTGLTDCIACGCLSLDRCTLANPDDVAAARGPGSRLMLPPRQDHAGCEAEV
ncbi:MerR family redox-sensitive transcriptional activator SoxR [Streptosporangium becharense]|uniref:MerR family redox-sensitive transcriptional activator SoxR n=1 Tax=Streptosporangium becharense TaxID=1816182 RepID=A0A7W9IEB7_9ACTN|nr:redox-sensitive transcriptional activator SoxR [Streptosporangium becharense]MBB2912027.1 MerR family redox-sensitive transcriptional activator SoxR [Streptosporangium becharense]MBB5818574.1 MerR family redox-sensitive transcriptional activator SoxR [Streptosporangium becharense]